MSDAWEERMGARGRARREEQEAATRTRRYVWEPADSVTLRAGQSSMTVYLPDGTSLLLNIDRIEDDPDGGVVPRLYTSYGIAMATDG